MNETCFSEQSSGAPRVADPLCCGRLHRRDLGEYWKESTALPKDRFLAACVFLLTSNYQYGHWVLFSSLSSRLCQVMTGWVKGLGTLIRAIISPPNP